MNKKTTLILACALCICNYLFSQVQRLVLVEEFTQASCGPCIDIGPKFNALLQSNKGKVVAIKYHLNYPGYDPMNLQTQTYVAPRNSLYGINGIPDAQLDGSKNIYPSDLTQQMIDSAYNSGSPFSMNLSFSFTPKYDSVNIKCVYKCAQAVNMTTPKFHVAMIEKHIHFNSPPGAYDETEFYDVLRVMYPNANGTVIKNSWAVGDMDSVIWKRPIPSYIYNKGEIAIVAFIQDNTGKQVLQAALADKIPLQKDAGVSAITNVPTGIFCSTAPFTPTVKLKNYGISTLTNTTINYKVDNGPVQSQSWTGSLTTGATADVPLVNGITPINGQHKLYIYTNSANGLSDDNLANDTAQVTYKSVSSFFYPMSESFTATSFPPTNWLTVGSFWSRKAASANGVGTGSAHMNFEDAPWGSVHYMYFPGVDLSTATSPKLSFDHAYAQGSPWTNDTLRVQVSTNCGSSWTNVFSRTGAGMSTTGTIIQTTFTPTASQWKNNQIDLSAYAGKSELLIRFKAFGAHGNGLFIDNINISSANFIQDENNIAVTSIYPNPFHQQTTIDFYLNQPQVVSMKLFNTLGEELQSETRQFTTPGQQQITIYNNNLAPGAYYVKLIVNQQETVKKLIIE